MEILLDDAAPEITFFSNANGWIDDHRAGTQYSDVYLSSYSQKTFHATYTDGDYMEYRFNGTGIAIMGSKRQNHGVYGVKIDDESETFYSSFSTNPVFQTELYSRNNLTIDKEHIIRVTNYPTRNDPQPSSTADSWLDIDHLVISHDISGQVYTTTLDDSTPVITYDASWSKDTVDAMNYNSTIHLTGQAGASMILPFNGISIQVFSGINVDHDGYSVSIDGGADHTFNGSHFERLTQVPHYTASGLSEGPHTLKITNTGKTSSPIVGFDYAVVNSTVNPNGWTGGSVTSQQIKPTFTSADGGSEPSGSKRTNVGAIAGGVVGGVVGLTIIAVLAWCVLSRKPRRVSSKSNNRHKSYIDFPSGSTNSRSMSVVESKIIGSRMVSSTSSKEDSSPTPSSMFGSLRGFFKKKSYEEEGISTTRSSSPQGSIAYFYTPNPNRVVKPPSSASLTSPPSTGQGDSFDNQIYTNPPSSRNRPPITQHVSHGSRSGHSITSRSSAYSQGGETYLTDRLDNIASRGPIPLPSPPSQESSDYEHMPLPPLPAATTGIHNASRSSTRPALYHADASSSLLPSLLVRQSLAPSLPTIEQHNTSSTHVSPSSTPPTSQGWSPETPGDYKRSILGLTLDGRSPVERSQSVEGNDSYDPNDARRINMTPSVLDLEPPILSPPPEYGHIMAAQQQHERR
ncbi:hypothetical protein L486_00906 [Kwoniella mangroviensis CBS 10435]|uniref:Transmembrane protein n=1 Tax=Kwoniella mangroviensis CBS 10435 TaxID=1331196 RepID=A0A1B9J0E8_9TREE|nr:hypothetical protein L486_00906 [Kwoniella mangroviensis CBS 10435]